MHAPWKNPRSENLWFRRRVPADLIAFMGGKREIKFSLGTADPDLAKVRFMEENGCGTSTSTGTNTPSSRSGRSRRSQVSSTRR
jgi:hypothetical protein